MIKKEKKSQKPYLTDCNLLIVHNLWQVYYQVLLIILQKDLMKLHTNTDMVIKNVKCGIKYKDFEHCHKYTNVKNNLTEYKYLCCNKNYQKRSMKFERKDLLTHTIFLIMISKSFFCRCKSGLPV